jgi:hypothetical protein
LPKRIAQFLTKESQSIVELILNKEINMEKLELHYVSNSGFTFDSNISKSIHVKEIVIFYLYFEWV